MKNSIRKTNKFLLIFSIIALNFIINTAYINAEEKKVIKVGDKIVEGFKEVEEEEYISNKKTLKAVYINKYCSSDYIK